MCSHLCVLVAGRHHLREVNNDGLVLVSDHDVELIEVAMNDAVVSELHDQVHKIAVQLTRVFEIFNLVSDGECAIRLQISTNAVFLVAILSIGGTFKLINFETIEILAN